MGKLGKKIELRNRTIEKKDIENFVLVDLVIDGEVIETTNIPNGSYYFWEDMEEISQKAMKRLIDNNSERMVQMFNVGNLNSLMTTSEQKKEIFQSNMTKNFQNLDIPKLFEIIDSEIDSIKFNKPEHGEHPNPFLKFSLKDDIIKNFIAVILTKYNGM